MKYIKTLTKETRVLVIGACGQIGTELTVALRKKFGWQNVIAADIYPPLDSMQVKGPYIKLDVLNRKQVNYTLERAGVTQVYHLAAVLSAKGEADPVGTWDINMRGLLNVLDASRKFRIRQVFWPSSIAVFGPNSFKAFCSQQCNQDPVTVYGISKSAGEFWCQYYFEKYGLDVRSLRYPGLISYTSKPGGGTTDYAVEIFHEAITEGSYTCFLKEHTTLPMMYMPDAIRATLELMEAPVQKLRVRTSYNISALSFSPVQLAEKIKAQLPDFTIKYQPDFRQAIADSWPSSIDDHQAREDWGWRERFDLEAMTADMILNLKNELTHV
jgi:nucleoside-diphosphate-sugar epimerase